MSCRDAIRVRGATGRADLLRLLATVSRDTVTLDCDASGWFGYALDREPPPEPARAEAAGVAPSSRPAPVQERRLPLRLPFIHAIVRREPRQPQQPDAAAEEAFPHAAVIDEDAARPPSEKRLIAYEDLVPQARLLPALRRALGASRAGPLDLERLTQLLAASQLPRHLPRRTYRRWHPDLVVLLDFCPRLWPYRWDMHRLAEQLLRQAGRVSVRIINHGPYGPWSDWLAHQNRQSDAEPAWQMWKMPPAGTPVLIVSDLGMLFGPQSAAAEAWAEFVKGLIRTQRRPMALVPLGAGQLGEPVLPALPVLRWSPDARPQPIRAHGMVAPQPDGLDDLLAMIAATRRVDPPLLRAMRRLNPHAPLNAGLEGALWCHADVVAVQTASIRPESRERHLRHFADRLKSLHAELDRERCRHHAHLRAVLNHEETLLWAAQVEEETIARAPGAVERVAQAEEFMRRLVATLTKPETQSSRAWWSVAQGIVQRADQRMWKKYGHALHRLLALQLRALDVPPPISKHADVLVRRWVGTLAKPTADISEHADLEVLSCLLDPDAPPVSCWLVQDALSGQLVLQGAPAGARQSPLGEALLLDAGGACVGVAGSSPVRWLTASALPVRIGRLSQPFDVHIETSTEILEVAAVRRPRGAGGWRCGHDGIEVVSPPLAGHRARWQGESLLAVLRPDAAPEAVTPALEGDVELKSSDGAARLRFGIDARFGVFADVTLATGYGRATQRLRWIEPGTFLMGSPEDEPERGENEGPQHVVTISQGLWLADTACTQELWQAVIGDNPSGFQSPDRPVEMVSWYDVQDFLRRLGAVLPGCRADLPTEAEWEYACRAGTTTPFSFGATITTDQVNYHGDYLYADGVKGEDRGKTVAVKSLPPNSWGLYEMHGNVWEWCADGVRTYNGEPQVDPRGPEREETHRADRGGFWVNNARYYARSAARDATSSGGAGNDLGFRLCLRSIEPDRGRPGGPAGRAPGGRATASPRPEAKPSRESSGFRLRDLFCRKT